MNLGNYIMSLLLNQQTNCAERFATKLSAFLGMNVQ
jgi:hypothetical protein